MNVVGVVASCTPSGRTHVAPFRLKRKAALAEVVATAARKWVAFASFPADAASLRQAWSAPATPLEAMKVCPLRYEGASARDRGHDDRRRKVGSKPRMGAPEHATSSLPRKYTPSLPTPPLPVPSAVVQSLHVDADSSPSK